MTSRFEDRRYMVGIAALVLVALVACGGNSDPKAADDAAPSPAVETPEAPTPEEFVAEADAICTASATAIATTEDQYTRKTSEKQSIAIDAEIAALVEERLDALSALTPPEELAEGYDRYLGKRAEALQALQQTIEARRDKNMKKAAKFREKQNSILDQVSELGGDLGLFACANRLPSSEEQEVKTNLVRYFRTPDRSTCEALSTARLLRALGGVDRCGGRLLKSKKVKITHLDGVAEVRASAELTADAYPGTIILVELRYEDGTYRVNSYEPKES